MHGRSWCYYAIYKIVDGSFSVLLCMEYGHNKYAEHYLYFIFLCTASDIPVYLPKGHHFYVSNILFFYQF
jgi:hypothetical protein